MAQRPPSKKTTAAKRSQAQDNPAAKKKSQEDSYFDEFFQSQSSHQLDAAEDPEQQRQWISDQLMWETTLGLREDDTINRVITPQGEEQAPDTPAQPSPPQRKPLSEQERQMLRTQVTDPTATQPVPATPQRNQTAPKRAMAEQRPAPQPRRSAPAQQPQRPSQAARSHTGTRPVTPKSRDSANTATASKAPVKRVPPRPTTNAAPAASPRAAAINANAAGSAKPQQPKPGIAANAARANVQTPRQNPSHRQTQPVAVSSGYNREILLDAQSDSHLSEEEWGGKVLRWAKNAAVVLSIAIISFLSGYYVGGKKADEVQMAHFLKSLDKVKAQAEVSNKPVKPRPKAAKPKPAPSAVAASRPPSTPEIEQPDSKAVFEGKDIALSSPDQADNEQLNNDAQPQATNDLNANPVIGDTGFSTSAKQDSPATDATPTTDPLDAGATDSQTAAATENQGVSIDNASTAQSQATPAAGPQLSQNQQNQQNEIQDLLKQSLQAFNNKQWQTLVDLSSKVLALDPTVVNALTNRAAAYTELNLYGLALKDCNTVIDTDPNNSLAINNRGYVYEKMGDIQNAVADYKTACSFGVQLSCKEVTRLTQAKQ